MAVFSLDVTDHGQCDLRVAGDVDVNVANQLITMGLLSLTNTGAERLVIDLADVTFMDSTGLGALVTIRDASDELAKELSLRAVPDRIRQLLAAAGLDRVFVVDSPDRPDDTDNANERKSRSARVRQSA